MPRAAVATPITDARIRAAITQQTVGEKLFPIIAGGHEDLAGLTAADLDEFFDYGDMRRFKAAIDGVTNDATAVSNWLDVGIRGTPLYFPGGTSLLTGWAQKNITAALKITAGPGAAFKGEAATSFINPAGGDIDIDGVQFDTWLQVIENAEADATVTDSLRVTNCEFRTMSATPISHECQLNKAWIRGNHFSALAPALNVKAYAIRIGTNTYANQDNWSQYVIAENTADGIHAIGTGDAAFCLVYGHRCSIFGNKIKDVDTANGECWGIYTKTRYSQVLGNSIEDLVTAGASLHAINIKGTDRGVVTSPNGYANIVSANVVKLDNDGNGIRIQCEDILCNGNFVENADKAIVVDQPSANTPENVVITGNHLLLSTTGALKYGVELSGAVSGVKIADNLIDGQGGTGHCVRLACTDHCSDIAIVNNTMKDASRGVSDNTTAGKVKTSVQVNGNQIVRMSGDAIAGKGIDGYQIRGNQFEAITGAYMLFDAGDVPTRLDIGDNGGMEFQTVDGTLTNAIIIRVPDEQAVLAELKAVAKESDSSDRAMYGTRGLWYRDAGGNATLQGAQEAIITTVESDATWPGATLGQTGASLVARVQGVAAQTINWSLDLNVKSL